MNLLDIIFFSLKLFGAVTFIIVGFSFALYKIKSSAKLNKKALTIPVIENEPPKLIPEKEIIIPESRPVQRRFVIMNEFNEMNQSIENAYISINEESPDKNINTFNQNKPLNIFSRYSNNSFEPMHKIKL